MTLKGSPKHVGETPRRRTTSQKGINVYSSKKQVEEDRASEWGLAPEVVEGGKSEDKRRRLVKKEGIDPPLKTSINSCCEINVRHRAARKTPTTREKGKADGREESRIISCPLPVTKKIIQRWAANGLRRRESRDREPGLG